MCPGLMRPTGQQGSIDLVLPALSDRVCTVPVSLPQSQPSPYPASAAAASHVQHTLGLTQLCFVLHNQFMQVLFCCFVLPWVWPGWVFISTQEWNNYVKNWEGHRRNQDQASTAILAPPPAKHKITTESQICFHRHMENYTSHSWQGSEST